MVVAHHELINARPWPGVCTDKVRRTYGGYAASPEAWTYWNAIPKPSTWFTWWRPGDRGFALSPELCDQLIALAPAARAHPTGRTQSAEEMTLTAEVLGPLANHVSTPGDVANGMWWRLDVDKWMTELKRYRAGTQHTEHSDLSPDFMRRKLATIIQLSEGYEGGRLQFRIGGRFIDTPTERGTVIVFPSWLPHRVTPVTSGERWILIATGWGPAIR